MLMKKTFLITLLALLGMTQTVAQEYEYVPFVREGVKWVYYYVNDDGIYPHDPYLPVGTVYLNLEFKGDTVINGKTYKMMHKYYGDAINEDNDTVPIFMREENKVVYGIIPEGQVYAESDCPIGGAYTPGDRYDGNEFVVYDFKDPIGFLTGFEWMDNPYYEHDYTDTITIGNYLVKRYNGSWAGAGNKFLLVEGIGEDTEISGYTLHIALSTSSTMPVFYFSHFIENGEIVYKGLRYRDDIHVGIDEVVTDKTNRALDPNHYNLMGQPVGKDIPTTPGIYIHQGKKIVVR